VTKKEIVKQISDKLQLPQIKTKEIVQLTFDAIVDTLVSDGRIELRNFGVFEVKRRKPRKARNPRTGVAVEVEAKNVVTFQPGKVMEEKVREAKKVVVPKRKTRKPPTRPSTLPVPQEASAPVEPVPLSGGEPSVQPH
jgi:integration host factor subunit beta